MNIHYTEIFVQIAPVFLIMGIGFLLRHFRKLTEEADASLMRVVVTILYPSLILSFIIDNPALQVAENLYFSPVLGYICIAVGFLAGLVMGRLIGLRVGKGLRTFAFSGGIFNYGYLPIPLIAAFFAGRETLGVLLVFNVGVEMAVWSGGIILVSGAFHWGALKRLVNPPLIALIIGLSINGTGYGGSMPSWFTRLVEMLGGCAIPMGILLAGASLRDLIGDRAIWHEWKIPAGAIFLRLGLLPVLFVAMAVWIPNLTVELQRVLIVQAAMPAGIFPIVLSRHYGGEPRVAVQIVLSTTAVSLVTIPLWVQWGMGLIS